MNHASTRRLNPSQPSSDRYMRNSNNLIISDDIPTTEDDTERPSKRTKHTTNKLACVRCRNLKARCEMQIPTNGKCIRCTRLSFDCVWVESQKRGRRSKNARYVKCVYWN